MSVCRYFQYENQTSYFDLLTGSINKIHFPNQKQDRFDDIKLPRKRRDDTNATIGKLYEATLMKRNDDRDAIRINGRRNKNEILGLTNARLVKEKHLTGSRYIRDIELVRGISTNINNGSFVLVLRTDGRIIAMSDEVEHHFGKTMRSLYTQCINIYQCLSKTDGEKLRAILSSSNNSTNEEYRIICDFRLPKGKRPSRLREDIKTITIAGHFYSCHEQLFIARCEALVSNVTNETSSSQTITNNNNKILKFILNDDMSVQTVSSSTNEFLGYSRNDIIGQWFGRFLSINDTQRFEKLREIHFQGEQPTAKIACDIFDIYTNYGEHYLTFLCQIRTIRERRSKLIKYSLLAQLIDPSIRNELYQYIHPESQSNPNLVKIEQTNMVSPIQAKVTEETITANSPSLSMGLLMFANENSQKQQISPFPRTLSNYVAPFVFDDQCLQLFDNKIEQYSINQNYFYGKTKDFDNNYIKCELDYELASIDALINDDFSFD